MERYQSRKFLLVAVALVGSIVMVFIGVCSAAEWFAGTQMFLALYFGANVVQKGLPAAGNTTAAEVARTNARVLEQNTLVMQELVASNNIKTAWVGDKT